MSDETSNNERLGQPCEACEGRGVLCHLRPHPERANHWLCPECGKVVSPRRQALMAWLWIVLGFAAILAFEWIYCG